MYGSLEMANEHNSDVEVQRKRSFLARVEWLLVTSRSHTRTDKCKISIMMFVGDYFSEQRVKTGAHGLIH